MSSMVTLVAICRIGCGSWEAIFGANSNSQVRHSDGLDHDVSDAGDENGGILRHFEGRVVRIC